jgi:transcriptional regulator with XRE-family HTH domain
MTQSPQYPRFDPDRTMPVGALRYRAGMSQADLARALDVSRALVSMWERQSSLLNTSRINKLATILHWPAEDIWIGTPDELAEKLACV